MRYKGLDLSHLYRGDGGLLRTKIMTSDRDIYRSANILIRQHRDRALNLKPNSYAPN